MPMARKELHLPGAQGQRGLTAKVLSFLQTCTSVARSLACRLGSTRPKSSSGNSSRASCLGCCLSAAKHRCFPDRRKPHTGAHSANVDAISPEWLHWNARAQALCWPPRAVLAAMLPDAIHRSRNLVPAQSEGHRQVQWNFDRFNGTGCVFGAPMKRKVLEYITCKVHAEYFTAYRCMGQTRHTAQQTQSQTYQMLG